MEKKFSLEPSSNRVMKRQDNPIGRFSSIEEQADKIAEQLDTSREMEKTAEERVTIKKFNDYLQKEINIFNIQAPRVLEEKIKIFTPDNFNELFEGEKKTAGTYVMAADLICLKKNGLETFRTLLHEMVHYYSFHKFDLEKRSGLYQANRVGYDDNQNFIGLNEGITELVVAKILTENKADIKNNITYFSDKNVSDEEKENFFKPKKSRYSQFSSMMIDKISEIEHEPKEQVLNKFEGGMFTGEMMHLREIEKVFGKNSLKILAKYAIYESETVDWQVYDYFKNFKNDENSSDILEILAKAK